MICRYSPYESPFVPSASPGIYWVPKECQYSPHDAHVRVFAEYRAQLVADLKATLKTKRKNLLAEELESMAFDSGIKAASRRYRSIQNDGLRPFAGRQLAGERYKCLD